MKGFLRPFCIAVAAALFAAACKDDKPSGSLAFAEQACFLQPGATELVSFRASDAGSFSISSKPEGWADPVIDAAQRTLAITAPAAFDDETLVSGDITLTATGADGGTLTAKLFVTAAATDDRSDLRANSYLFSRSGPCLIDVSHRSDGATLATASVEVIWQTSSNLVQYLTLREGKASFHLGTDSSSGKIRQGNALLGARDASGKLLWSWHVWSTNYDPDAAEGTLAFNGEEVMTRNLGALDNANGTADAILASYGLYYQWGRKDPFVGPSTYTAANGTAASIYNGSGKSVSMTIEATDLNKGTDEYAAQNPLCFLTGTEESNYDWLARHDPSRWGLEKRLDDPCPYGWKVAPHTTFDGLEAAAESAEWANTLFSMMLTREGVTGMFMGAGYRNYRFGKVQNVFFSDAVPLSTRAEGQPWTGLYWTSWSTSDNRSEALYFHYGMSAGEQVEPRHPMRRANGLPVRCVRDRR